MTGTPMTPELRAEVVRRLADRTPAYRVAKDLQIGVERVRNVRDEERIPRCRPGQAIQARSEPVRWDDLDNEDGDPTQVRPHRIPVGQWCVERPNQARWLEMCDKASDVEAVVLRDAMCRVLGLKLSATTPEIYGALAAERRYADDLAAAYIQARGRGW